ncbi:hypothetical protein [uncultured Methanobrevibacter sp.]|uniref:hypothetical protein n=1 Tax=uncultured Methanobrevibacter sp. TaxID=253161 RepID=UPI0025E49697|nr:hypothetical protein [uncultured Methanobrevibacter sp.]
MTDPKIKTIYSVTDDVPLEGDVESYTLAIFAPGDGFSKGDEVVYFSIDEFNKINEMLKEIEHKNQEIKNLKEEISNLQSQNDNNDLKNQVIIKEEELNGIKEDLNLKDKEINSLKSEIAELKDKNNKDLSEKDKEISSLKDEIFILTERLSSNASDEFLPDKISQNEELYALQNKVNQRNELLYEVTENINQTMEEAITDTVKETTKLINANNKTTRQKINNAVDKTEKEVTERNRAMASNINNMVDSINEEIKNVSFWKLLFNRKEIEIKIPTSDLNKQVKINMPEDIVEDKDVNVDILKIKNDHKIDNLKQLWIDTEEDDSEREPIDVNHTKKE